MVDVKHGDRVPELSLTRRIVSLGGRGSAVATVGPVGLVGPSWRSPVGRLSVGENRRDARRRWHQNQRLRLAHESAEHPSHTDPRVVGSGRVLEEEK